MVVHSELYFGALTEEVEHMSFYSAILSVWIKDLLSKVMLKSLQARPQQYVNHEIPGVQMVLEKAEEPAIEEPAIKTANICWIIK